MGNRASQVKIGFEELQQKIGNKSCVIINTLNETNNLIEINQYLKFDENCYKIPFEHSQVKIKEITFNINDYFLTFEIIDDKINDFYIKINNSLNILDILMIKEISYIKTLLI